MKLRKADTKHAIQACTYGKNLKLFVMTILIFTTVG